jgi:hypothetical protein
VGDGGNGYGAGETLARYERLLVARAERAEP